MPIGGREPISRHHAARRPTRRKYVVVKKVMSPAYELAGPYVRGGDGSVRGFPGRGSGEPALGLRPAGTGATARASGPGGVRPSYRRRAMASSAKMRCDLAAGPLSAGAQVRVRRPQRPINLETFFIIA